jgi:hypothetical protein
MHRKHNPSLLKGLFRSLFMGKRRIFFEIRMIDAKELPKYTAESFKAGREQ